MKKIVFLCMIVFAGIFIATCVFDSVHYCPYCSSSKISKESEGIYQCNNAPCGKKFGAKEVIIP